jgi:hypothetical protein
MCPNVNNNE